MTEASPHRDQIILLTGATGGLGRPLALALAKRGATLVLLDRSVPKLESLYDEIIAEGGPQPALYPMDLAGANEQDYIDLANALGEQLGALDHLIHLAAELKSLTPIALQDASTWFRLMQVNLHAPWLLNRALITLLKERGEGADASILFTLDGAARTAYWAGYGVSKAGLEGLFRITAAELEDSGVRVNAVDPGRMRTALRALAYPAENRDALPTAESVIPAYLTLLSPKGGDGQLVRVAESSR